MSSRRQIIAKAMREKYEGSAEFCRYPKAQRVSVAHRIAASMANGLDADDVEGAFFRQTYDYANAMDIAEKGKTIIFSSEQASVFSHLSDSYTDALEYKLPFGDVIIQFDKPVDAPSMRVNNGHSNKLVALLLRQWEENTVQHNLLTQAMMKEAKEFGLPQYRVQDLIVTDDDFFIQNVCVAVYDAMHVARFTWHASASKEELFSYIVDDGTKNLMAWFRNMAIACIGYINCENVYLEKQGEVDEAVNRKREAKGKSRLEPYYVCRIRGVQYDSHATGEGSKHGIRYDVRGHFRRLETGKTIWVRPHQRGLQNELYVPKVYKVEKGSKPEWQA